MESAGVAADTHFPWDMLVVVCADVLPYRPILSAILGRDIASVYDMSGMVLEYLVLKGLIFGVLFVGTVLIDGERVESDGGDA